MSWLLIGVGYLKANKNWCIMIFYLFRSLSNSWIKNFYTKSYRSKQHATLARCYLWLVGV